MRTRDSTDAITEMPPPPAPTARDANPWPMESESRPVSRRHRRVLRRQPDAASRGEASHPDKAGARPPGVAIALAVAFMIAIGFIRLRNSGNIEDLAGVLFALVVLVLFIVTRKGRRKRSRSGGRAGSGVTVRNDGAS